MQLLFFSQANLQDRLFLRDVFKHFPKLKPPFIIVHDAYQENLDAVRMLTKRVSAHLSESMVPNLPFSGEQRNLLSFDGEASEASNLLIKTELIRQMMATVSGIVLNTLVQDGAQVRLTAPELVLKAFRRQMDLERILFFPDHPASPLGGNITSIGDEQDYQKNLSAYEEEKNILDKAFFVKPAVIVSAHNFFK